MRIPAIISLLLIGVFFISCSKKSEEEQAASKAAADTVQVAVPQPQEGTPESPVADLQKQSSKPNVSSIVAEENGMYTIQVSAWRTRSKAEREARRFRDLGLEARVESADLPELGGRWYRVRIGHFAGVTDAKDFWHAELQAVVDNDIWIDSAK